MATTGIPVVGVPISDSRGNVTLPWFLYFNTLGGGSTTTGGGTGTVQSVNITGANGIGVSGAPITTSGTIALTLSNISTGTITAASLSANSVTAQKIFAVSVSAGTVTTQQVVSANISAGTVTAATISASNVTSQAIYAVNISAANVTASRVAFMAATTGAVNITVSSTTSSWTFTLPTVTGTVSQVLQTDGTGRTSWTTVSSSTSTSANLAGAFSAYRSGNQTGLTGGAYNKVSVNAENFDVDGWFDSVTNFRYTPLLAGKYFFCANASANDTLTDTPQVAIYKNGARVIYGSYYGGVGSTGFNCTSFCAGEVDMNGSTDFIELYCYLPTTITQVNASSNDFTTIAGFRVTT